MMYDVPCSGHATLIVTSLYHGHPHLNYHIHKDLSKLDTSRAALHSASFKECATISYILLFYETTLEPIEKQNLKIDFLESLISARS